MAQNEPLQTKQWWLVEDHVCAAVIKTTDTANIL